MNNGLLSRPKHFLPGQGGFGFPRGAGVDSIRAARSGLVEVCLEDDPLALYTFQESSGFPQDYSGLSRHLTAVSGAAADYREPGLFSDDYGMRLDGCVFSVPTQISAAVDNWTMEVVWNIEACTADDSTNSFALGSTGGANRSLYPTAAGKFAMLFGNINFMGVSNGSIKGVGYTHVVAVRESGTLKYYLNGTLDTANAGTDTPLASTATFKIGSGDGTNDFVYALAAVYDTAFSAARVAEHFAQTGI